MRRICGALHHCAERGNGEPKHCRHTLRAPRSGTTDWQNSINLREKGCAADLEGYHTDRNDLLHFNDNVNIYDHHFHYDDYDGPSSLGG